VEVRDTAFMLAQLQGGDELHSGGVTAVKRKKDQVPLLVLDACISPQIRKAFNAM
jgi:hypothetical protein